MKKFSAIFVILVIFAILAGCGSSIKVTDLGFAKVVQYKDKDAIGPNHTGVAIFATPQQQVVTAPQSVVTRCDARSIYDRLERNRAEIAKCRTFSLNNLRLRLERGNLFLDLFVCKCDHESISEAIKNFEIAARNYRFGKDIKQHKAEADNLMSQVYENWTKAKRIDVTVCNSTVTVPQPVALVPQHQFVYGSTGYGAGIIESILPSALIAGGMVGAASVLRPSDTNVTATGGGGGAGGSGGVGVGGSSSSSAASSSSSAAAAATGN